MRIRMFRPMLAITCLSAVLYFSVYFSSFHLETNNTAEKKLNYMGLDGEVTYLPVSCSDCALVGTSGYLTEEEHGSEIDNKYSCIFRFGFSPSRGMEKFVGSRTTVRIVDSFSFYPFLKQPYKLATGPYTSDIWVLYDRRAGDIVRFHQPLLSPLVKKQDTRFLWLTRQAEKEVYETLMTQAPNSRSNGVSGLWFSIKAIQDAGCKSLVIYGIPDHQICKRDFDVNIRSLYWDSTSDPICNNGVDASYLHNNYTSSVLPRFYERKALSDKKFDLFSRILFIAPPWPS